MGRDNRTENQGAHVRQSNDWRVRMGSTARSTRVCNQFELSLFFKEMRNIVGGRIFFLN